MPDIKVRRFNEAGVNKFESLFHEFKMKREIESERLQTLIVDDAYSSELDPSRSIEIPSNNQKFQVSRYLSELLDLKNNRQLYRDRGLWTWISAYMLELIVPLSKNTIQRDFKERALYILEADKWNKYYRHLLAFSTLTYTELQDKGRIFLRGAIYERGEVVEQLAAVYNIQRNKSIIEAATLLFYDSENDAIIKGAAQKNIGGTARRFRDVLKQFQLTFDLNAMSGDQIVNILPIEFDKWKQNNSVRV